MNWLTSGLSIASSIRIECRRYWSFCYNEKIPSLGNDLGEKSNPQSNTSTLPPSQKKKGNKTTNPKPANHTTPKNLKPITRTLVCCWGSFAAEGLTFRWKKICFNPVWELQFSYSTREILEVVVHCGTFFFCCVIQRFSSKDQTPLNS